MARLAAWNLERGDSGVGLDLRGAEAAACLDLFENRHRDEIETAIGRHGDVNYVSYALDRATIKLERMDLAVSEQSNWPELQRWMADVLVAMDAVFRPLVRDLDEADLAPWRSPGDAG